MLKLLIFIASLTLMGLGMWLCVENETPWWSTLWLPAAFGFVFASEEG